MAHSLSAKKRIRQNLKCRARNRWRKVTMRTTLKAFEEKLLHASPEEARKAFVEVCSVLDRTASSGTIHKNTAARTKSRLNARLKARTSG